MILARGGWPDVPPVELDGIRYQESDENFMPEFPGTSSFLEAIDVKTETRLWFTRIYDFAPKKQEFSTTAHQAQFFRMELRAATREVLIEDTAQGKYFVNIDTQKVRHATQADFAPKIKRVPPPEVPPIEYKGLRYQQEMGGHDSLRSGRGGHIEGIDIKTGQGMWRRQIYAVPLSEKIEFHETECYFTRMVLLPGDKDILIENEAGEKYLFNIKRCETLPLIVAEADYQPEEKSEPEKISLLQRIKAALQAIFRRD